MQLTIKGNCRETVEYENDRHTQHGDGITYQAWCEREAQRINAVEGTSIAAVKFGTRTNGEEVCWIERSNN